VFVNVAAAYAESYGCDTVVTGFNREEAEEFPDNSREFVERANAALAFSTRNAVRVESFTVDLDKRAIVRMGLELKAPLSIVWSCYRSGPKMCGDCASCARLRSAIDSLPAGDRPVLEFES
jgi:7-cyano-7-deazaguanine synthase